MATPPMTKDPFLAAVEIGLPRHALWQAPVVVGVSGGADSMALALALVALAPSAEAAAKVVVAHAEYDLRPDASADRNVVAALASRLGLQFRTQYLSVRGPSRGEGLEARARRLRYCFFEEVAREAGARHVAIAHTADDQAETILHRILRGTGPAGLAGMAAARQLCDGIAVIRPLLAIRRHRVREWLLASGQQWCEDASNCDTRYARNFLRHEVVRRCTEGPYPATADALVRLGEQVAKLSTALRRVAEDLLDRHGSRSSDGSIVIDAASLAALDHHLIAEVMVVLWTREKWPRRDMTTHHYEQLVDMVQRVAAEKTTSRTEFPGAVAVVAEPRRRLVIRRQPIPYDVISTRL